MPLSPEKQAEWRESNRSWQRNYHLRRLYGISLTDYDQMVAERNGKCDICGRVPEGKRNQACLHVDHDHRTGRVRGLLCSHCNRGLGFLGDSPETLSRAAAYLAERG